MILPSVMAARRSPKPLVRVRVSWGMPNLAEVAQLVVQRSCKAKVEGSSPFFGTIYTESNAAGMVLRLALKTRFSEMGWGSTPLLSANYY